MCHARGAVTGVVDVPPRFAIVPVGLVAPPSRIPILITPSVAFGDGSHETTCLCLQAVGALAPRDRAWRMLDFGSGTGVLAIGAVKLGARAVGVEISELAIAAARENARLNGVEIAFVRSLPDERFDLVVGNILRGVLVDNASEVLHRVAEGGTLVLSGLASTDVPDVSARYAKETGRRPEVYERGEWRALVWRALSPTGTNRRPRGLAEEERP